MARQLPSSLDYLPPGAWVETFPRQSQAVNGGALVTGRIRAAGVWVLKGWEISSVLVAAGATAGAGLTNSWVGIWRQSGELEAVTADITTAAWSANSLREFTFSTPWLVPESDIYWVGVCIAGTTIPSTYVKQVAFPLTIVGLSALAGEPLQGATTAAFTTPGTAPDPIVLDDLTSRGIFYAALK